MAFTFFTYRQEPLLLRTIRHVQLAYPARLHAGLPYARSAGAETVPSNIQFAISPAFAQPADS
jgi:hypothetical protein